MAAESTDTPEAGLTPGEEPSVVEKAAVSGDTVRVAPEQSEKAPASQMTPEQLIHAFEASQSKSAEALPEIYVGDTVRVGVRISEGNKQRVQPYEGVVIAKRHGGLNETITVRRIFQGVGVERVFMLHSPQVASVHVERRGKVRRAKLFYLRDRVGKATRVKQRFDR